MGQIVARFDQRLRREISADQLAAFADVLNKMRTNVSTGDS